MMPFTHVPYAVGEYWQREALRAREEREFWILMTWQLLGLLMALAVRRYHLHLWASVPIEATWFVSIFVLKFARQRRERERDKWTRKHLL